MRKLAIIFTCTVCNTRSAKTFSYLSYTKGVVLVKCDGCQNLHLVADNLGWFGDEKTNIETIMKENGDEATRISSIEELKAKGLLEILPSILQRKKSSDEE